jgi:2-dehydro-3-deoxyphosphogluconate aldolase/(4S)-4-hydroxy-2-oxoglutarate aldolase
VSGQASGAATLRRGRAAELIRRYRLIVVLRRIEPRERLLALVDELAASGARVFEITFDAPSAGGDVAAVRESLAGREDGPFLIGAGTVTGLEQLEAANSTGVDFAVAPLLDPAVVGASVAAGLPFVPGAFTPTEIAAAWAAGATFVKLFPASAVGPAFVRELRGPLPEVEIIPTGGVDGSNAADYLAAGAVAVGIGGGLTRADAAARRTIVESVTAR